MKYRIDVQPDTRPLADLRDLQSFIINLVKNNDHKLDTRTCLIVSEILLSIIDTLEAGLEDPYIKLDDSQLEQIVKKVDKFSDD